MAILAKIFSSNDSSTMAGLQPLYDLVVGLLLKDSNRPYGNYIFHTAVGTVILP
jgi:hypothetical protein